MGTFFRLIFKERREEGEEEEVWSNSPGFVLLDFGKAAATFAVHACFSRKGRDPVQKKSRT